MDNLSMNVRKPLVTDLKPVAGAFMVDSQTVEDRRL